MIPTTNRTISIHRLSDATGVRTYTPVQQGVRVYINASSERIESGFNNEGSFYPFTMLVGGNVNIEMSDKIVDEAGTIYKVRGVAIHMDLTGTHGKYSLTI